MILSISDFLARWDTLYTRHFNSTAAYETNNIIRLYVQIYFNTIDMPPLCGLLLHVKRRIPLSQHICTSQCKFLQWQWQWQWSCSKEKLGQTIIPFHKSQCALRCLDPMSQIQNTSSQRSLATWLTVAANEQNDDLPASVSLVSVQPVIGWLKDEVARYWSQIVHRPRPYGNVPLPCIVRNGVWYCVKYSSLKSFYVLQS